MAKLSKLKNWTTSVLLTLFMLPAILFAQETKPVNVKNVARAETDLAIQTLYDLSGGIGKNEDMGSSKSRENLELVLLESLNQFESA